MSNEILTGIVFNHLSDYMERYQISFQFWGKGNNQVYIEKDDVELFIAGGCETPLEAMVKSRDYLDKINRVKRDYNPNF